jgi:hypothetical protein
MAQSLPNSSPPSCAAALLHGLPSSPDHGQELDDEENDHQDEIANLQPAAAAAAGQQWTLLHALWACRQAGTY